MKNIFSFIRWRFVIPVTIVLGLLALFFVMFFDPILARGIESVASHINEAKVELDGFKTKFLKGRIEFARLQVTDKSEPMKNVVETGRVSLQINPVQLLSKRTIIEDAQLTGIRFDTPRKTSGALPPKKKTGLEKPSLAEKIFEKYKDRFKLTLEGLKEGVNKKIEFDPKNLEMVLQAESLKETIQDLPQQWTNSVNELKAEERLKKIEDDLKSIKETPIQGTEALTAVPAALKKLNETKEALSKLKADIEETKKTSVQQLGDLKRDIVGLKDAKKKDVDDLMSRFNLDFANPERLMEGLVGPVLLTRVRQLFHYVEVARKYMPSQKEKESLPVKARAKGVDIEFPSPAALPKFWLQKAEIEAVYQNVAAQGVLRHASSDPARVNEPLTIQLSGRKENQSLTSQTVLDHRGEINKDSFSLQLTGMDLSQSPGLNPFGDLVTNGQGSADLILNLIGESNLGGQLDFNLSSLKFDDTRLFKQVGIDSVTKSSKEDQLKMTFATNIARGIEKTPQVKVSAQIFGSWQDPGIKITSNLGGVLSGVIKDSVGSLVADQRKQLEAQLDKILKEKTAEVEAQSAQLQGKLNQQFQDIQEKVEQKINEATGLNLSVKDSSPISLPKIKTPSLDKLFKK